MKNRFFALEPLFFEICKMDKSGVIYMSIPFDSCITHQIRSKNELAMPKCLKIPLLGPDTKNKNWKIQNKNPTSFAITFKGKNELFKSDHQKYAFRGGLSTH